MGRYFDEGEERVSRSLIVWRGETTGKAHAYLDLPGAPRGADSLCGRVYRSDVRRHRPAEKRDQCRDCILILVDALPEELVPSVRPVP